MGSAADGESRAAGLVHTLIAVLFLLVFFGAIGYTFWPELMPALFRSVQTVRTLNAEQMASQYFDVRNGSQASEAQVSGVVKTLEQDYGAITDFLGIEADARIPLLFTDGPGPALADGAALNVFYDNGVMNIDTAPFFLALLADGKGFAIDKNLLMQGGFAIYVAESIDRAQGLIGQPTDAWVTLLQQNGGLVPLDEVRNVGIPQNEGQLYPFLLALLEGGSFVRWTAKTYGLEAAQALREGKSIEDATGLSMADAEQKWLAAVAAQELKPKPCELALPPLFPRSLCRELSKGS